LDYSNFEVRKTIMPHRKKLRSMKKKVMQHEKKSDAP